MSELREFFNQRKIEVDEFFQFLNELDIDGNTNCNLTLNNSTEKKNLVLSQNQIKIMKSNIFLILYNTVEGTINKSIEVVIDKINDSSLKNKDVVDAIKAIWLTYSLKENGNIQPNDKKALSKYINSFVDEIIEIDLERFSNSNKGYFSSGNLDSQQIKGSVLPKLGLDNFDEEGLSEGILAYIKNVRNDLAHGSKSFGEIGSVRTLSELKSYRNKVFSFIDKGYL